MNANPQPNHAKRLECEQLAAAVECGQTIECARSAGSPEGVESSSKLRAPKASRHVMMRAVFLGRKSSRLEAISADANRLKICATYVTEFIPISTKAATPRDRTG